VCYLLLETVVIQYFHLHPNTFICCASNLLYFHIDTIMQSFIHSTMMISDCSELYWPVVMAITPSTIIPTGTLQILLELELFVLFEGVIVYYYYLFIVCCYCCSRTDLRHYLLLVIGIIPILAHWKWRCDSNIMRRGAIFRCARMCVPPKRRPASGDNWRCKYLLFDWLMWLWVEKRAARHHKLGFTVDVQTKPSSRTRHLGSQPPNSAFLNSTFCNHHRHLIIILW
jgi:hypothetical protein